MPGGTSRRSAGAAGWLAWLGCLGTLAIVAAPAQANGVRRQIVAISQPAPVSAGGLATVKGRVAPHAVGTVVSVQRKLGRRWSTLVSGTSAKSGRFILTFQAPRRSGAVIVRAVARHGRRTSGVSRSRRLRVGDASGATPTGVRAVVIDPSVVISVPPAGSAGALVYAGGDDVKVGQIVAIGEGPATPYGFLGKVVSVKGRGEDTVASTVPASLLEAASHGSIHAVLTGAHAAIATRKAHSASRQRFSCTGSDSATFNAESTFNTSLALEAEWTPHGGLQSASLVANANSGGSVGLELTGAASCSLARTTVLQFNLPTARLLVDGVIPIVITSQVTVYVAGNASAHGAVSTSASAAFSATAGIAWTKAGGFAPIASFSPSLSFTRPEPTADAKLEAQLIPTVTVLVDGIAGPVIGLKSGLALSADTEAEPWWTLTAPVELNAQVIVPKLKLRSPRMTVWSHTFTLAEGLTIKKHDFAEAKQGEPYGETLTAVGGEAPYSWTLTSGSLPEGLSLDPVTGTISGTPGAAGTYNFEATATDRGGAHASRSFSLTVEPAEVEECNPCLAVSPGHVALEWQTVPGGYGYEAAPYIDGVEGGCKPGQGCNYVELLTYPDAEGGGFSSGCAPVSGTRDRCEWADGVFGLTPGETLYFEVSADKESEKLPVGTTNTVVVE